MVLSSDWENIMAVKYIYENSSYIKSFLWQNTMAVITEEKLEYCKNNGKTQKTE